MHFYTFRFISYPDWSISYSEVVFIEPQTSIVMFLLDRTFVRFSDGGFRKSVRLSMPLTKQISAP